MVNAEYFDKSERASIKEISKKSNNQEAELATLEAGADISFEVYTGSQHNAQNAQANDSEEEQKLLTDLAIAQQRYANFCSKKSSKKNTDLKAPKNAGGIILSKDKDREFEKKQNIEASTQNKVEDSIQEHQLSRDLIDKIARNQCHKKIKITSSDSSEQATLIELLAKALAINTNLQHLNLLWNNRIGDDGASVIATGLASNKTLQHLGLRDNQIGADGAVALSPAIKESRLQSLDLMHNKIGNEGAVALSLVIKECFLHSLDLKGNEIDEKFLKPINKALDRNRKLFEVISGMRANTLQDVKLSNLSINDDFLIQFSEALKSNSSVTSINLEHNLISDFGLMELTAALKANPANKVSRLNLKNNLLSQREALQELAESWPRARAGMEQKEHSEQVGIDISGNYFDENKNKDFHKLLTQYTFVRTAYSQGTVHPSKVKADLKIDTESWLIFLMSNPRTNHAMLFFEGLDERGQLFLEMAHLTAPSLASPRGGVKTERWPSGNARKSFEKLQEYSHFCWQRRFTAVQTVRAAIKKEENEAISFSSLGYGADNCLKWAKKKLEIIKIEVEIGAFMPYYPNLIIRGQKNGDTQKPEPERRWTCVIS